jgi:exonuclease VII large subunit
LDEKIEAETARATSAETTLDEKVDAEAARAESAESDLQAAIESEGQRAQNTETALDAKIDQEIADRTADVDAEETRAKAREDEIETALNAEITRATQTEQGLNHRIDLVNDELDSEESRAQAAEQELRTLLTNEIADRKADVDTEETRAKAAEEALGERIDDIISGATPIAKLEELIEKLGYKDNETLTLTNEHEVAFGEWNISHTSEDASGQTIFSVGNGTSESEKSNAVEVMKNGDVYVWVAGDFMNINKLLGQLAHEVYDTD